MNRILLTLIFGGLLSFFVAPMNASTLPQQATVHAFKQTLQQPYATFALPVSEKVSLPLQWHERLNSFSAQGIHTYVGTLRGETVAYVSIDAKGNVMGGLLYGAGYDIASHNGQLVLTPMRHVENECGLHAAHTAHASQTNVGVSPAEPFSSNENVQMLPIPMALQTADAAVEAPRLGDGVFRIFRLAVFMSYNEFKSDKFKQDFNKVKAFWAQLETFLNEIYVRDLGVQFQIISDERLVEKAYKQAYKYTSGTGLINNAIGTENYDIGLLLDYQSSAGVGGLATLGGVQYNHLKGSAIVTTQRMTTMAHELGHMFGSDHPFVYSAGLWGTCTEPGAGQSVVSYGRSSQTDFISLECIKQMQRPTANTDNRLLFKYPNTSNTAPRIDRSKMKQTYLVPQGTFFSIPVYASDAEQTTLNYSFNQFGCSNSNRATFPVYPPQQSNKLEFGRRYSEGGSLVTNSDKIPVGNYQFWFSVSDALPLEEAIAKRQAPLYDGYIADVSVVAATPFKITSAVDKKYAMGDKLHLTWSVDPTFFPESSRVRVVMSDDFGKTYRHVLVPSTANDGACDVYISQQIMERVPTYSYIVPETGEKIDIWFAGKGLLRLETIDDDVQYYDFTDQTINEGGIEVTASKVVFGGLPQESYIVIGENDAMPAKPEITATIDGRAVAVSYTETTEGNLTTRTWEVTQGGKTSGVQQFIERKAAAPLPLIRHLSLTASGSSVSVGDEVIFTPHILSQEAASKALQWQVSNENVLRRIADGRYRAIATGDCKVSVRTLDGSNLDASCDIHVSVPTGVQQVAANGNLTVKVQGGVLLVSGLSAETRVALYDLTGRKVASAVSQGSELRFSALLPGIYLVALNGRVMQKVHLGE